MKLFSGTLMASAILMLLATSCEKQIAVKTSRSLGNATIDAVYGSNTDYYGIMQNLALDVYYPYSSTPAHKGVYPLIVFVHGGGFLVGDKNASKGFCQGLADKGYVVATINYRLGWNHNDQQLCSGSEIEQKEAQYRAVQDAKAALRFLVSKAGDFSIDTSWIFLAGSSAGCGTVLHTTYVPQDSADILLPDAKNKLGLLNTADNNLTNKYTIKGLACMWGGLYSDDLITPSNAVPAIFFHGANDIVVPLVEGYAYGCNNLTYLYGSKSLYNKLSTIGVPAVIHIDPQGGHGVYTDVFRIDNIACFFNDVIAGTAKKEYYEGDQSNCQ